MKPPVYSVAVVMALCLAAPAVQLGAQASPVVVVRGPTVVAFFEPVMGTDLENDADTNEVLADFQLYTTQVQGPLKRRGVEFQVLYERSFRMREGGKVATFRPGKVKVGYYLVAPGKRPRIEYGVMTDVDLLQLTDKYFGFAAR